jgi:hypothetical protein
MLLGLHAATSELCDGDRLCLLLSLLLVELVLQLGLLLLLLLAPAQRAVLSYCLLPGPVMRFVGLVMCIACQSEVLLLAVLPCPKLTVSAAGAAATENAAGSAAGFSLKCAGVGAVPASAVSAVSAGAAAG